MRRLRKLDFRSTRLERVSDFDLLVGEQVDQSTLAGARHPHDDDDNIFLGLWVPSSRAH